MRDILILVWLIGLVAYLWWWFRFFLNMWALYAEFTQAGCLFHFIGGGVLFRTLGSLAPGWNILVGLVYWPIERAKLGNAIILSMHIKYDPGLLGIGVLGWLISLIPHGR